MSQALITTGRMVRPLLPRSVMRAGASVWGSVAAWRVDARLRALTADSSPVLLGPWLGEIGFELLYWIPFLRHAVSQHRLDPERFVAVSRGGVASWYAGVADRYVEILDLVEPEELRRQRARRARQDRGQKQVSVQPVDERILGQAANRIGLDGYRVLHPAWIAALFRPYWWGLASLDRVERHLRRVRLDPPEEIALPELPDRFAAVKAYANDAMPEGAGSRRALQDLLTRVAERLPLVLLVGGTGIDEHRDIAPEALHALRVEVDADPARNLALQSAIISRARILVSTYGGFSYLGPSLGVDTLALYRQAGFFRTHLELAESAFREQPFGAFHVCDLEEPDAADQVDAFLEAHAASPPARGMP